MQDELAVATGLAERAIGSIKTVRVFNAEVGELSRFSRDLNAVFSRSVDVGLAGAWFEGAVNMATMTSLVVVLGYGGVLVADETITAGALSSFLIYSLYLGSNVSGLSSVYAELMSAAGASQKLFEIIDREPHMPPAFRVEFPH